MTREQILRTYMEDELIIEKGYLKEQERHEVKWSDHGNKKMIGLIKFAIEGVINGDSQTIMTRKINQFLDKS